jgi:arylsulfatase A-like enzyme
MGLCHAGFAWDLHPEERHLGQILRDAGYATAGIGVIHETRGGPARCGLDEYRPLSHAAPATTAAVEMLALFAAKRERPFYMQVGFIEPHRLKAPNEKGFMGFLGPHLRPDASRGVTVPGYLRDTDGGRAEVTELQGAVRHVDESFGRLMEALRTHGLEQDTLVIFTTDHGVALPRAKCAIYDPGLQVAFILRLPTRAGWSGGRTLDPMISNIDYLPTILELVGAAVPANVQGRSFAPLLDGRAYAPRDMIFGEITYHDHYDPRRCVRTETHKLIANFSSSYSFMDPSQSWRPRSDTVVPEDHALAYHPPVELYDLRDDPWELRNIAEQPACAAVRKTLLQALHRHMVETGDPLLQGAVTSPLHMRTVRLLEESARCEAASGKE